MEKINIAKLLENCPKGMELNCLTYENVELDYIEQNPESKYPVHCLLKLNSGYNSLVFTHNGCSDRHPNAKCVIFPKGKTTWEGFVPPYKFKDGDILVGKADQPFIFKSFNRYNGCFSYCGIDAYKQFCLYFDDWTFANSLRFATEEEKEKLFKVIKENGYKWNAETKVLEKLIEPKFDISTLKPFDRVLVRGDVGQKWTHDFFGFMDKDKGYPFVCVGHYVIQCIPYEGNEHLLGKTDDCKDFYKTWRD